MKRLAFYILLFCISPLWVYAMDGGAVGNGGDSFVIEFKKNALDILMRFQRQPSSLVSSEEFESAIDTTQIESTDKPLFLKGVRKEAINYPLKKKIIFDRKAWAAKPNNLSRMSLVLHEYLGIMRIDDSDYKISMQVMKELNPGSIRCESHFWWRSAGVMVMGPAEASMVLNLTNDEIAVWSDDINHYITTSGDDYIEFIMNVIKDDMAEITHVRSGLDPEKPDFQYRFPVRTRVTREGQRVLLTEVSCH